MKSKNILEVNYFWFFMRTNLSFLHKIKYDYKTYLTEQQSATFSLLNDSQRNAAMYLKVN